MKVFGSTLQIPTAGHALDVLLVPIEKPLIASDVIVVRRHIDPIVFIRLLIALHTFVLDDKSGGNVETDDLWFIPK
jgi:hypothetical protein